MKQIQIFMPTATIISYPDLALFDAELKWDLGKFDSNFARHGGTAMGDLYWRITAITDARLFISLFLISLDETTSQL